MCVEGFIFNGKLHHHSIVNNVYNKVQPEVFDALVGPAQGLTKAEHSACWELWDTVLADLISRGCDNQFVDLELFILPGPRCEVMEINCRTGANYQPCFHHMFHKTLRIGGCMFSTGIDLLANRCRVPPNFEKFVESLEGRYLFVCLYRPEVKGTPAVLESDGVSFYAPPGYPAHLYGYGADETEVRERCDRFYASIVKKYQK